MYTLYAPSYECHQFWCFKSHHVSMSYSYIFYATTIVPLTTQNYQATQVGQNVLPTQVTAGRRGPRVRSSCCVLIFPQCYLLSYSPGSGIVLELAKEDKEVFRMVVPQLQQMYQNSLTIARSKSKKVQNAKNQLAASGASLPISCQIKLRRNETRLMI